MSLINSPQDNIKDVYSENMVDELRKISDLIEEFNYVSMDTEFPGIVYPNTHRISTNVFCNFSNSSVFNGINTVQPYSGKLPSKTNTSKKQNEGWTNTNQISGSTPGWYDLNYKNIKMNVDDLKMIQFGITLSDKYGNHPEDASTWQFNFKFDLDNDIYLHESIQLLEFSGIDFNKFYHEGIEQEYFAENIIASGVVLNENVKWITFHGAYDFAYLLKTISNQPLPEDEQAFLEYLFIYFPNFYDLRYMIKNIAWLKGGLSKIASDLDIKWNGAIHQAGCDSILTSKVFTKLCLNYGEFLNLEKDLNMLFGFNTFTQEESEHNQNENNKTELPQSNPIYASNSTYYNNYNKFQMNPPIRPNNGIVYTPYVNMNYNLNNQKPNVLYSSINSSHTSIPTFNNYVNYDYNNYYGGNVSSFGTNAIRK
jgi:CCR4-NOT transcription complex subunit 7/8